MDRPLPRRVLFACLVSMGLMTGLAAVSAPAQAQVGARAYAPENLSQLSVSDQTRVISLEYREQSSGGTIPDDQLRFYLDQVRQSRWTFSRIKADIAQSLATSGGGSRPPLPGPDNAIRCESNDGRPRTCQTQWQGQSRLLRQLSTAACVQGRTWFMSRGQVTVSNGCRAEFGPGRDAPGQGSSQTVQCESIDGRMRSCGSNLRGRIELMRQISNTRCVQGSNFGLRDGSVWVDRGCRGVFLVTRGGNRPEHGGDYSVTCSSTGNRYTTCAWDARRGQPYLIERLSNQACSNGYSWGYSARTGLWVNHGCRARFGAR